MEAWDESVAADQEDSAVPAMLSAEREDNGRTAHEWVHRRIEVTDGALDSERDTTLMEADHPGSEQNLRARADQRLATSCASTSGIVNLSLETSSMHSSSRR